MKSALVLFDFLQFYKLTPNEFFSVTFTRKPFKECFASFLDKKMSLIKQQW